MYFITLGEGGGVFPVSSSCIKMMSPLADVFLSRVLSFFEGSVSDFSSVGAIVGAYVKVITDGDGGGVFANSPGTVRACLSPLICIKLSILGSALARSSAVVVKEATPNAANIASTTISKVLTREDEADAVAGTSSSEEHRSRES